MAARSAQKPRDLQKVETLNSFNAWKDNLVYILSIEHADYAAFLAEGATWQKEEVANRGFTDDANDVAAATRKTAIQKAATLRLMLGQIANFATVVSRNQIIKNSTSLSGIWSILREHYGFQSTGSRFLTLSSMKLDPGEKPEDLYQKIVSFFDDNLLTTDGLLHHGIHVTANESITPTIENTIVLLWLERVHVGLPALVQQKYGPELRNKSLASLKSEISLAMQSLLLELQQSEDTSRVLRATSGGSFSASYNNNSRQPRQQQNRKKCCLCEAAKRPNADTHFLSQCRFLPEADRKRFSRVRNVEVDSDDENDDDDGPDYEHIDTHDCSALIDQPAAVMRRVKTRRSPYLSCMYRQISVRVCLDTGAESNFVSYKFAMYARIRVFPSSQGAMQADQQTSLNVVGEVKDVRLTHGAHTFKLDALVTENDIGDILAGEPFLEENDIAIRPFKKQIIIRGRDIIPYEL